MLIKLIFIVWKNKFNIDKLKRLSLGFELSWLKKAFRDYRMKMMVWIFLSNDNRLLIYKLFILWRRVNTNRLAIVRVRDNRPRGSYRTIRKSAAGFSLNIQCTRAKKLALNEWLLSKELYLIQNSSRKFFFLSDLFQNQVPNRIIIQHD
jgi:hypothetical protein